MDVIESAAKAAWELYGGSTWEQAPRERQKQTIAFVRAGLLAVAGADISKEMINAGWEGNAFADRFEENFRALLREIAIS